MRLKLVSVLLTFVWCIFMGVTAISIGFGAMFPSMNRIAAPLVCPDGTMDLNQKVYNQGPGRTITTVTWYCVDGTSGARTKLGIFPMALYAGVFYGLVLFVIVIAGMIIIARRKESARALRNY